MAASPQLVTGGSGFIALELVRQLLESGHSVHATVRSLRNERKTRPLKDLQAKYGDRLELFEADLLKPGSFAAAMAGCSVVHHVASPFFVPEKIKDGQKEMVEPALEGTRSVLESVNETNSVTRVVLTSSVGAIAGDYSDALKMKDHVLDASCFNETSTVKHNPYHYAKVLAEKEAWKISKSQSRWDLVVICPGMTFGPTLTNCSESGSLFLMDELLSGWMFYGVPDLAFLPVDVREVASAHIKAAETPSANGRYVVAPPKMTSFVEISRTFKAVRKSIWLPSHQLPTALVKIVGPLFGLTQKWMANNLGVRFTVDNSRSIEELGIVYRPVEETLVDHCESWLSQKNLR